MSLLSDKLLALSERDPSIAVALAGAITPASRDKPATVDLSRVDRRLIALAKATIHAGLSVPAPFDFAGHRITVKRLSMEGDLLRVDLTADCPTDGPYFFCNPPLAIVTAPGSGDPRDPDTYVPRETVEDPDAVLKEIVGQAVHHVAVQRGGESCPR